MSDIGDAVRRQSETREAVRAEAERLRRVRETEEQSSALTGQRSTPPNVDEGADRDGE